MTTADAALGASDLSSLFYNVEGFDSALLEWGTANAKTVTLSFWVKAAKTGTHHVAFANSAGNRGYAAAYTVSVANEWEYKTITLTGDLTGTWIGATTGKGLTIRFTLAAGSNYQASASDTWEAMNVLGASDIVNEVDDTANNFFLTGVQLEVGSSETPFAHRVFQRELELCHRYYERKSSASVVAMPYAVGLNPISTQNKSVLPYAVKRAFPTITFGAAVGDFNIRSGGAAYAVTALAVEGIGLIAARIQSTVASGLTGGGCGIFEDAGSGVSYIEIDSEL